MAGTAAPRVVMLGVAALCALTAAGGCHGSDEATAVGTQLAAAMSPAVGSVDETSPTVYFPWADVAAVGSQVSPYAGPDWPALHWVSSDGLRFSGTPAVSPEGTAYAVSQAHVLYAFGPDGTRLWSYAADVGLLGPPSLGTDGAVYSLDDLNRLHALEPDGTLRWCQQLGDGPGPNPTEWTTGGPNPRGPDVQAHPSGGVVVLGRDLVLRRVAADGSVAWELTAEDASRFIVCDDGRTLVTLYVGGGVALAVSPEGDELWRASGQAVWPMPGGDVLVAGEDGYTRLDRDGQPAPSPMEISGHVVAVLDSGEILSLDGTELKLLSAAGALLGSSPAPGVLPGGLGRRGLRVDAEGRVYLRTGRTVLDGPINENVAAIPSHVEGDLSALSMEEGVLWSMHFMDTHPWVGAPVPAPNGALIMTVNDRLVCLKPGDPGDSLPALDGFAEPSLADVGYTEAARTPVGVDTRRVHVERLPSGRLATIPEQTTGPASLVITDPQGRELARRGIRGGYHMALAEAPDGALWVRASSMLYHLSPDGTRWREVSSEVVYERGTRPGVGVGSAPVALASGAAVVDCGHLGIMALEPSGRILWRIDGEIEHDRRPVVGPEGNVYLPMHEPAPALLALDPDGEELWRKTFPQYAPQPSVLDNGTLIAQCDDGFLRAYTPEGEPMWELPVDASGGTSSRPKAWAAGDRIYALSRGTGVPAALLEVDAEGKIRSRQALGMPWSLEVGAVGAHGSLLVHIGRTRGDADHITRVAPDGVIEWRVPHPPSIRRGTTILPDGSIASYDDGDLVVYRPAPGDWRAR